MSDKGRPALRLVRSKDVHLIGKVRLSIFSHLNAPSCDAVVVEEDIWQILAADPEFTPCSEHPIRIWTELLDAKPVPAGTVLLREGWPLTLVAVVYDFDAFPCCRSRWISIVLVKIFRSCRERQVRSLLLPLPGVRHGRLSLRKSLRLVIRALKHDKDSGLRRVLLACNSEEEEEKLRSLLVTEAELWSRSSN